MAAFVSLLAASAALRVASLDLCADEYLLLLARPGEIASVSRLAHDPADSVLWRRARVFPANRGDLEGVLPQRPGLLLTSGGAGRATGVIASRLDIAAVRLTAPASIGDVEVNMVKVAAMLGDRHRADRWRQRLARLASAPRARRDSIFLGGGGTSMAANSLGSQWMALAGLRQRRLAGGRASLELLAGQPPEILLRSTYRRNQPSLAQAWLDHPLARGSRSRVIDTDGRPWTCSGPLMLEEIERLRALR